MIEMLRQGFGLLDQDPFLAGLVEHTLRLAIVSAAIAAVLGLPLAYWIASGSSRLRRLGRTLANAGLGLPPVGVGVYAFLLLPGRTPWGQPWYGTMNAMVLVQVVIALPIVVALSAGALRELPAGLLDQARAFGASGWRLAVFALREAKVGVIAAIIVSMSSAIGEIGAVTIVAPGVLSGQDSTLAMGVLDDASGVRSTAFAVEHTIVMLALLLVLGALLTIVQHTSARATIGPRRSSRPARSAVSLEARA